MMPSISLLFIVMKKKLFILLPLLFFVFLLTPLITHTIGNYKAEQYPNRAKILQEIAYYTSFGLLKREKQPESPSYNTKDTVVSEKISVPKENIQIKGKRITHNPKMSTFNLSALFVNNSGYGIPSINIDTIKIYNKENELIGKKTDHNPQFILVKDGEYPFSFPITNTDPNFVPASFEIEFNIPDFTINEQVVRLENVSLELVDIEWLALQVHEGEWINYSKRKYELVVRNPAETPVEGIYYIAFLKHDDYVFTRLNAACCHFVSFLKEQEDINLDTQETFAALAPQQEEIIQISIYKDNVLHLDNFEETKITPVFYVMGVKNPELKDIHQNPPVEERKSTSKVSLE